MNSICLVFLLISSIAGWYHGISVTKFKLFHRLELSDNNFLMRARAYADDDLYTRNSKQPNDDRTGPDSYYPEIVSKSEAIILFPPLFLENGEFRREVFRHLYQHTNRSILIKEDLKKHVSSTAHCMLGESPFADNFCMFLQEKELIDKQVTELNEWLRRNVGNQTFFSSLQKSLPPVVPPKTPINVEDLFVLISRKNHMLKVSLAPRDHSIAGQRLPEDETLDSVIIPKKIETQPAKKKGKGKTKGGESVDDTQHVPSKPLFVTDDDLYLQDLADTENHPSAIL